MRLTKDLRRGLPTDGRASNQLLLISICSVDKLLSQRMDSITEGEIEMNITTTTGKVLSMDVSRSRDGQGGRS